MEFMEAVEHNGIVTQSERLVEETRRLENNALLLEHNNRRPVEENIRLADRKWHASREEYGIYRSKSPRITSNLHSLFLAGVINTQQRKNLFWNGL